MLRYQQQFEFFDNDAINRSIRFVNLGDDTQEGNLNQVLHRIITEVESYSPGLVFIDSFRSVVLSGSAPNDQQNELQQFMQRLGMVMTSWQATTF